MMATSTVSGVITVRKTKNVTLIKKLNERIFPRDPLDLRHNNVYWILRINEMPVGFAVLHPLTNEPETVFYSRAGLLPKARGRGLHRRLIDVRNRYCKKNLYKQAITYTMDDNVASANNLISCGFKFYDPANRWADSLHKKEVIYFLNEF